MQLISAGGWNGLPVRRNAHDAVIRQHGLADAANEYVLGLDVIVIKAVYVEVTPERQFVAGETHLYLGRRYRLKVVRSLVPAIKLKRGFIEVYIHRPSQRGAIQQQVEEWQKAKAQEWFHNRLAECLRKFPRPKACRPDRLIIKQLKQRWGSMGRSGRLVLNSRLLQAAPSAR